MNASDLNASDLNASDLNASDLNAPDVNADGVDVNASDADVDSVGLEVLDPGQCLALAAGMPIGRIVFTDRALPAVQPVNFVIDNGAVIIRTGQGSKLAAATRNAIVAFEIDDFDDRAETGWSVTLVGRAQPVRDPAETARLARLPLRPWAPGIRDRYIRIHPEQITGRRIPGTPSTDKPPYRRTTGNGTEPG